MTTGLDVIIGVSFALFVLFIMFSFLYWSNNGTFLPFVPIIKLVKYLKHFKYSKIEEIKVGDYIYCKNNEEYCKVSQILNISGSDIDLAGKWYNKDKEFLGVYGRWGSKFKIVNHLDKVTNWRKRIEEGQ